MAGTKLRPRKATATLKEDHAQVKKLFSRFEELEKDDESRKAQLFAEIRKEIEAHARIEEEIFYPAIEATGDEEAQDLVAEARVEHQLVKTLIEEIDRLRPGDEEFDARMKVMMENVKHHAEEEEEKMFPFFDDLERDEQNDVSERLSLRKGELLDEE